MSNIIGKLKSMVIDQDIANGYEDINTNGIEVILLKASHRIVYSHNKHLLLCEFGATSYYHFTEPFLKITLFF